MDRLSQKLYKKLKNFKPTKINPDQLEQDLVRINDGPAEKIGKTYSVEQWSDDQFELIRELKSLTGEMIEVGGPTFGGYPTIVDTKKLEEDLGKKILVSNIYPGQPVFGNTEDRKPIEIRGIVDFQADATNLPFKDNSLSAFFASGLPAEIREKTLIEAYRVLEPGGFIIWQLAQSNDLAIAKQIGLEIKQYSKTDYFNRDVILDLVFQKPTVYNSMPD